MGSSRRPDRLLVLERRHNLLPSLHIEMNRSRNRTQDILFHFHRANLIHLIMFSRASRPAGVSSRAPSARTGVPQSSSPYGSNRANGWAGYNTSLPVAGNRSECLPHTAWHRCVRPTAVIISQMIKSNYAKLLSICQHYSDLQHPWQASTAKRRNALVKLGGSSSPVWRTLQSPPFIKGDRGGFVDGPSIQNPPCPPLEKGEMEFWRSG